jgi:hypothetical protein
MREVTRAMLSRRDCFEKGIRLTFSTLAQLRGSAARMCDSRAPGATCERGGGVCVARA